MLDKRNGTQQNVTTLEPTQASDITQDKRGGIFTRPFGQTDDRPDAFQVRALFVAKQTDAETSTLWQVLRRMPGVDLVADPQGIEARQFGFRTSGEVRLYDDDLQLRFRGGITISRGHRGDNPGSAAILAALDARESAVIATPVFGCALFDSALSTNSR